MKVTLESTDQLVELELDLGNAFALLPARVWQGQTASGTPCFAFIVRIAPEIPIDDPRQAEFERELVETPQPREAIAAWLRSVNGRVVL